MSRLPLFLNDTDRSTGITIQREDLQTSHEEEDLMVQQALKSILNKSTDVVSVVCDDTDALVHYGC